MLELPQDSKTLILYSSNIAGALCFCRHRIGIMKSAFLCGLYVDSLFVENGLYSDTLWRGSKDYGEQTNGPHIYPKLEFFS